MPKQSAFISRTDSPLLSVLICTYNRADLLEPVLESLCAQTVKSADFEVVIIDDGSTDHTKQVVQKFQTRLQLRYHRQNNAGLASAKNHAVYVARAPLLLFQDDDDIPGSVLLEEHLKTHRKYSDDCYAVLGYTALDRSISTDPLMHFVTEIGCFLFSYPNLKDGDVLDYTYFWGGRSSCKRSFLIEHGMFNPVFRWGCEDIELGFRLSKSGFKVVYNARAVTTMVRKLSFDSFCQRCIRQGRSQYVFGQLHQDPEVQQWDELNGAEDQWQKIDRVHDALVRSARNLDLIARQRQNSNLPLDHLEEMVLSRGYLTAFRACKLEGIHEQRLEMSTGGEARLHVSVPSREREIPAVQGPAIEREKFVSMLDSILADPPMVHGGGTITWGLSEDTLRFLDANVGPSCRTLETGSGLSTLLFAAKGCRHTCITPFPDEVERLRKYCEGRKIALDKVSFVIDRSEAVLPQLPSPSELDLALIDGCHAFPMPFLDWFYVVPKLKIGGIVIVDDTQLWTGEVLRDFLAAEAEWRLEVKFVRGAAFRKIADPPMKEWTDQPYVRARSAV
jgi:GT2 family glycosyltransferase